MCFFCRDHLPWGSFWQLAAADEGSLLETFSSISLDSQLVLAVPGFGGAYTSCFTLVAATAITAKGSRNTAENSLSLLICGVSLPQGTVSSTSCFGDP